MSREPSGPPISQNFCSLFIWAYNVFPSLLCCLLSAVLKQQWHVYSIYMPVFENSSGKTFLCFGAWNFRNYKGPYSPCGDPQRGLEEQRPGNQKVTKVQVCFVFSPTIIKHVHMKTGCDCAASWRGLSWNVKLPTYILILAVSLIKCWGAFRSEAFISFISRK